MHCYAMQWCSGVHFQCFPGYYDEKSQHRIVLQGEKWVESKWFNAGLFIGKVIEKINL